MSESVFLRALGSDADKLHPAVFRYAAVPGALGELGSGHGTFEVAGSRFGRWNLLAQLVVGPGCLVTEHAEKVPFAVESRPRRVADSAYLALETERVFHFDSGSQRFADTLRVGAVHGELMSQLGERGRLELSLRASVSAEGWLRLDSDRAWVRILGLRIRIPRIFSVVVETETGYEEATGKLTIASEARSPILGTVLEYRGTFAYRSDGTR